METKQRYAYYKWSIFLCMYAGYTLYILDRKVFSFATPAVVEELDLEKDDLGLIASSQNVAYTISKFLGGVLSDRMGSRTLFSSGLFLSGIITIFFTMFNSVPMFTLLWFLCGLAQGAGWPSCANILRHWFAEYEMGTYWGILSTSMNLACSVGPILTTLIIVYFGWRACMVLFGTLSLGMAGVALMMLIDAPEDIGITDIPTMASKAADKGPSKSRGRGTWQDLLASPLMWTLCLGYAVVFMTRTALLDWMQLYLIKDCDQSPYTASLFISCLETGGIFGSVVAGIAGDRAVSMTNREDTRGSPRLLVLMAYVTTILVSLHLLLFTVGESTSWVWILMVAFCLGFGLYGPIAIYGVVAMETAPSHLAGTSSAIVSLASNTGGIFAGLPFSYLAKRYEWFGAFVALEFALAAILVMQVLTRNIEYKMVPIKKKLN